MDDKCVSAVITAKQTRAVDPMLYKCWADVEDGGPTIKQRWLNVSRLLGGIRQTPDNPEKAGRSPNVGFMLGH